MFPSVNNALRIFRFSIFCALASCTQNQPKTTQPTINVDADLESAQAAYFNQDYGRATQLLTPLLGKQQGEAEYWMALIYLNDNNQQTSDADAVGFLEDAIDQGNVMAMWELGRAYEEGRGVQRNYLFALDWFRKHRQEQPKLDQPIYFEDGKSISYQNILTNLIHDAKEGNVLTQLKVAKIYDEGAHIKQSDVDAFYWYKIAANNGNPEAALQLGYFYCRGIGTDKNIELANTWFEKSQNDLKCEK